MIVKFVPVHFVIQQMRKKTVEENTLIIKFVKIIKMYFERLCIDKYLIFFKVVYEKADTLFIDIVSIVIKPKRGVKKLLMLLY